MRAHTFQFWGLIYSFRQNTAGRFGNNIPKRYITLHNANDQLFAKD